MEQMNKLDSRQQLLVVTMEECGELVQACSKILRRQELYGDSKYIQNLKEEIGDVYSMIKLMQECDVVSWEELEERMKREVSSIRELKDFDYVLSTYDIENHRDIDAKIYIFGRK